MLKVCGLAISCLLVTAGSACAGSGHKLPVWSYADAPTSDQPTQLLGVAAVSSNAVWAVGSNGADALTALWDGVRFNAVKSAKTGAGSAVLEDVSGSAPNDVWAVGHLDNTGRTSLIEHWNGKVWSVVASPNIGGDTDLNLLTGVIAITPDNAWAVGTYSTQNGGNKSAIILHWDGAQWSEVKNKCGPGLQDGFAFAADNIWVVGANQSCQWNGRRWTAQTVDPGTLPSDGIEMQDISGVSSSDI